MTRATIQGYTNEEWGKVKQVVSPALHLRGARRLTVHAISLLEEALLQNPNEWIYWYALGDYYQRINMFPLSLEACLKAHHLHPNDPRTIYALATAYRFCAQQNGRNDSDGDDRALFAIALFLKVLDTSITNRQKRFVKRHITAMLTKYPDLEYQIPDNYQPNLITRLLHARKAGQLIVIVVMVISALSALSQRSATPTTTATAPPTPPDTLTLTVTWDQWSDIQNAIWFITNEMSDTLKFADVPSSRIPQTQATIDRYHELIDDILTQTENQTAHVPSDQLMPILDRHFERQEDLIDLLTVLDEAHLYWIVETLTDYPDPANVPETLDKEVPTEARDHTPIYELDDCPHWMSAADHIGQDTCIYGNVTSTYNSGSAFFINFSTSDTSFYAVSFDWVWDDLQNDCVIVYGTIERYQGRPQIVIEDLDQLRSCYQ